MFCVTRRTRHPSPTRRWGTPRAILLTTLMAFGACGPEGARPEAPRDSDPRVEAPAGGPLVIVGGALKGDNAPVYHAVLERREGDGPVCVVPTASGVAEESMASAIERLTFYAADPRHAGNRPAVIGLQITEDTPQAVHDPAIVEQISGCSGYWFVGGQQSRILRTFRPDGIDTPAHLALMRRWRAGAVVAGTSAGAAMMSSRSIGGGSSAEALEFGVTSDGDQDGLWIMPGMDFVPWAIVGQHHLARGRWGRLVVATLESPDRLGLGVDENTALVVDDGTAEVVGASSVLMIDVSNARPGPAPRTADGIRIELLGTGDRLDVESLRVTRAVAGKSRPDGTVAPVTSPTVAQIAEAPFERWALLHLLHGFATGEVTSVTMDGGSRTLELRADDDLQALTFDDGRSVDGPGTPAGLSVGPLALTIR